MKKIDEYAFIERWAIQHEEWEQIRDEMIEARGSVSAFDVTIEQRRRMMREGRKVVAMIDETPYELTPSEDAALARAHSD